MCYSSMKCPVSGVLVDLYDAVHGVHYLLFSFACLILVSIIAVVYHVLLLFHYYVLCLFPLILYHL